MTPPIYTTDLPIDRVIVSLNKQIDLARNTTQMQTATLSNPIEFQDPSVFEVVCSGLWQNIFYINFGVKLAPELNYAGSLQRLFYMGTQVAFLHQVIIDGSTFPFQFYPNYFRLENRSGWIYLRRYQATQQLEFINIAIQGYMQKTQLVIS
jgi:hypothetical protein